MDERYSGWFSTLRWLDNRSRGAPIGEFFAPSHEAFQLLASTSLGFPAHAIESINQESGRTRIVSPLFGLSGPVAALPFAYTEQLAGAKRGSDTALPDFFDIFNHRAQSLLYRAMRKHRYSLDKERALIADEPDKYSKMLSALSGLFDASTDGDAATGSPARTTDLSKANALKAIPHDALLGFAGIFACRTRSANALERMLRHYFQLDIRIRQFAARWVALKEYMRSRIGIRSCNNNQLGSCLLGLRSWQATAFFCVEIHNPNIRQFAELRSDGALLHALQVMVRSYAGEEFSFHIEIFTDSRLQTTARLSSQSEIADERATRLGWCGVLGRVNRFEPAVIKIS